MNKVIKQVIASIQKADKNSLIYKNNQDIVQNLFKLPYQLYGGRIEFSSDKMFANSSFTPPGQVGFGTLTITADKGVKNIKEPIGVCQGHSAFNKPEDFPKNGHVTFESWEKIGSCLQVWNEHWRLIAVLVPKDDDVSVPLIPLYKSQAKFQIAV